MKICCKCKKELPLFMFSKCSRKRDGLDDKCRTCKSEKKQVSQKPRNDSLKEAKRIKDQIKTKKKKFDRGRLLAPYIVKLLIKSGFDKETIDRYPQLITIKRLQVKTLRKLKTLTNDHES